MMKMKIPENPLTTGAELEGRVFVAASSIHGRGVMAARDYEPGEYIGSYWGIWVEEPTPYTLMIEDESGLMRHIEGRNLLRYLNHDDEPNCIFDDMHLFARARIAAGEELTFDYAGG